MKKTILIFLVGIIVGVAGTYLLIPRHTSHEAAKEQGAKQLYSCGMHPQVISEEPGDCPICGMKLTPIKGSGAKSAQTGERKILYWRAPMDPTEIYDRPGKSKMGMELVPVYEGEEAGGAGSITIDGNVQQNMNLRTINIGRRDISRVIRAFGKVTYAEDKEYAVNTKINGWIEKLYVNETGRRVKKGEPLLELYSPELVSTQEEYLLALQNKEKLAASSIDKVQKSGETLLASTRSRLSYWDISEKEIQKIEETGETRRTILLRSPANGIVTHKTVVEGDKVAPGMDLYHIADLSKVWVEATVYESELSLVKEGQKARLELDYYKGWNLDGRVAFIYPYLDQKSRAVNVRLVFDNPGEKLKPDMYATVRIYSQITENALAIPAESVIHSGERKIVFVAKEGGTFEPRQVKLGAESDDGYVQVISGLFEGEKIVTSGQFLLDSESKTREAIAKMRAAGERVPDETEHTDDEHMYHDRGETIKNEQKSESHDHDANTEHKTEDMSEIAAGHQKHDHREMEDSAQGHRHGELYACPMHPEFITSDPDARCPDCGMKLTKASELGDKVKVDSAKFYTCSMHPEFLTTDKDGRCPDCGMKLDPVEK